MAKKNKKNLKQLIAKKEQLRALEQGFVPTIPGAPKSTTNRANFTAPLATQAVSNEKALPAYKPGREIWRTLVSIVVIAIVLTGVVIAEKRTSFLDQIGNRLYHGLQLNKS